MGRNYRNIKAWQYADDLAIEVYRETCDFPKYETYGLTSQLRRAAVSAPTNIVEGSNRGSKKDYFRFLNIAKGSLAEVEYLLHLAHRLNYLCDESFANLNGLCENASKTLFGLLKAVEKEIQTM